ncbi:MAG: 1,4-dihydroxy-2-naphthoate octaprenyltransferase [Bacteroidales bacterium]|nr:1,4-dihydroxy-2-naphthoate octaprenyltransferase [Bacteroidales bacterium]
MKALIHSMRLRTLPLSLAGVMCGGLLAWATYGNGWTVVLTMLTACALQVLSNLSNEMGDHLSGVDGEGREGPNYSMTDGGLTVKQMWRAINITVVFTAVCGLTMLLLNFPLSTFHFPLMLLLGAAAIWAATHYTLGKKPYGYRGLGDIFVFIFFGLVSVLGSYYVVAHSMDWQMLYPAVGIGLLSVGVLNVNNVRDMASDEGIRRTVPLRIGERWGKIYQAALVIIGLAMMVIGSGTPWMVLLGAPLGWHLYMVRTRSGRDLDPALPLLVLSTAAAAVIYIIARYGL